MTKGVDLQWPCPGRADLVISGRILTERERVCVDLVFSGRILTERERVCVDLVFSGRILTERERVCKHCYCDIIHVMCSPPI